MPSARRCGGCGGEREACSCGSEALPLQRVDNARIHPPSHSMPSGPQPPPNRAPSPPCRSAPSRRRCTLRRRRLPSTWVQCRCGWPDWRAAPDARALLCLAPRTVRLFVVVGCCSLPQILQAVCECCPVLSSCDTSAAEPAGACLRPQDGCGAEGERQAVPGALGRARHQLSMASAQHARHQHRPCSLCHALCS